MPKFVPRIRKHKVLARQKQESERESAGTYDANTVEILPADKREREEKKRALREQLAIENAGKMSGKKKKRLDKYIDTKLKKEENLALLKKLAAQKIDTSLFQSSKKLGRGDETKKERLQKAYLQRKAGVDVKKNEGILFEKRRIGELEEESSDEEDREDDTMPDSRPAPSVLANGTSDIETKSRKRSRSPSDAVDERSNAQNKEQFSKPARPTGETGLFGSGLKRPLEVDEAGKPIIQTRKRQKKSKAIIIPQEVDWEGFSSENEDMDTDEDDFEDQASSAASDSASTSEDDSESDGYEIASELDNSGEGEEDDDESDTSQDQDQPREKKERSSAFKAWATQQRNEAVGFTPSTNITYAIPKPANFQPRAPESDPLPPELETTTASDAPEKAFSVPVERSQEIQQARLALPIVDAEQKIMEAINRSLTVVIWGATGSGKTTQVPQFLYESGYGAPDGPRPGLIGVTQPRRVAAVSMAKRVSDEMADAGSKVAYQVRFDTTTSPKTAIKFMTDGVLLREISQDFILTKYSAIVIDEAHERSVNTDLLIGMLSRIVDLRTEMAKEDTKIKPLKLVIMSATLRISDFTANKRLFKVPPPLLTAEGRQYTVTNHFSRRTNRDYVEEAFRKVCRGHRKLPRGGMLVFLTGQSEISHLAKKLRETFASTQGQNVKTGKVQISPAEVPLEIEDFDVDAKNDDYKDNDGSDEELMILGLDNEEDEEDDEFEIEEEAAEEKVMKVHVLPLYSQLPTNQQLKVFEPPPDGSRLIVLATNVAETSITIPGIRYVIDCGRAKQKKYDPVTGVQSFEIGWISKASANQRAGRAGRTGPGHCYRLYSSAVFERDFEEYAVPEILQTPLESVVLQLKSMGAPVVNFPFPTPPDRDSLQKAENLLSYLGALSVDGKVTKLGHELSLYPLNPRFARMLAMGVAQNLSAETIALVAALSVPELIIPENQLGLRDPPPSSTSDIRTETDNLEAEERSALRKKYNAAQAKLSMNARQADCIRLNAAVSAYAYEFDKQGFCEDMFLNSKSMHEATQLRQQLTNIVRSHRPTAIGAYEAKLPPPSEKAIKLLMQICAAGFIDQVAMRADLSPNPPDLHRKPKTAIDVPYITLFPSHTGRPAKTSEESAGEEYVYMHPSSLLARTPPKNLPGFIIYSHLQRAAPSTVMGAKVPKTRMHPLTPVTRAQIINIALGTPLLQVSKPKGKIVEMGKEKGVERRECEVELFLIGEKGRQGWGLGVRRVIQRKVGHAWSIEKILA